MRQQMSSAKEKWPAHSGSSRNVSPLWLTLVTVSAQPHRRGGGLEGTHSPLNGGKRERSIFLKTDFSITYFSTNYSVTNNGLIVKDKTTCLGTGCVPEIGRFSICHWDSSQILTACSH